MDKVEEIIEHRNKKASNTGKSSGYKGVNKQGNKFRARFIIEDFDKKNRVSISLGMYETPEAAYLARIKFIDSLK